MTRGQPQTRRRALVTGGAIRLGRAIALGLADAGFDVAIAYHRSGAAARTTVGDAGARPAPAGWSAYAASKAALEILTRVLAAELRPHGIAVNCVAPGPVLKPPGLAPARWRAITRGHATRPDDVVAAVVRFATCAPTITGRVQTVTARRG